MPSPQDLHLFRATLAGATAAIADEYFLLPVANHDGRAALAKYRERVYAYELYHQLRCNWPRWPFSLCGEVDKTQHPLVRGGHLQRAKPDLLAHVPGTMAENLAVVEIKAAGPTPPTNEEKKIVADVNKLSAFCHDAQYQFGVLLVYGPDIGRIRRHVGTIAATTNFDRLELWHHARCGDAATLVAWHE